MVKAHRYKVYDILSDEYHHPSRMATREHVATIDGATVNEGTEIEADETALIDGRYFDPK